MLRRPRVDIIKNRGVHNSAPRRAGMFGLARERSRPPVACRQRSPRLPTSETTMMSVSHASTRAALALVLASVSWSAGAAAQGPRSALDPITSAVINHPITTSSAEARAHFLEGLREFDLGRLIDANVRFKAAVAADPDFGFEIGRAHV